MVNITWGILGHTSIPSSFSAFGLKREQEQQACYYPLKTLVETGQQISQLEDRSSDLTLFRPYRLLYNVLKVFLVYLQR